MIIPILTLGAASIIYLWRYKGYTQISNFILTRDSMTSPVNLEADITFESVKLDENKMNKEDLIKGIYVKKQGYEYLNSLFFLRHKRIIISPIKIRVIIICVVFLICMCLIMFMPNIRGTMAKFIEKSIPLFVFIMYILSTGETICMAMFYNCDVSLLRYCYYREAKVILSNFTSRLKMTVLLNIIPAISLCLAIAGIIVASGSILRLISLIPLFLCIICLSCFFSIHHLFMYYVLQPYTAELTVKSPLFRFMNVVMYLTSYICIQIKTSSYYFALGVLVITILYMAVALVLTYKVAPRTFKLRQ